MNIWIYRAAIIVAAIFLLSSCKTSELKLVSKRHKDALARIEALEKENAKCRDKNTAAANELNSNVKNALPGFAPDELSVEVRNGKVYVLMSDKLLFKSGSANVEDKGRDALKKLATVLHKYPEIQVTVEGHTDNVIIKGGSYKDNWDLSVARATNITRALTTDYKLNPSRITASGKSQYQPVATNSTSTGRMKNRRTEIILTPGEGPHYSNK